MGDLTELADSIKANGVLQNLTVVPNTVPAIGPNGIIATENAIDGYFVVIGNRRLAAAKLADLKELPCVVSDMDHKDQVATMLLENMQRADLTVYEQAQGFQQLLDFGETVDDIADQTGFSGATIRRRVKLLDLDQDEFKKSVERGATLTDFAELNKINNIELKNKVLESIGTTNFSFALARAVEKEKADANRVKLIEQISKFATKTTDAFARETSLEYVESYFLTGKGEIERPDDAGHAKYFYVRHDSDYGSYGYITLYRVGNRDSKEDNAERDRRNRNAARRNELQEITRLALELRRDFVKSISNTKAKQHLAEIVSYAIRNHIDALIRLDADNIAEMLDAEVSDEGELKLENGDIDEAIRKQPERYLLILTYCCLDSYPGHASTYYDWNLDYEPNKQLDTVYDFLSIFGYEMSDEERAMREGTHELLKGDDI